MFPGSQSYLQYASNRLDLKDGSILKWSKIVIDRFYTLNGTYTSIRYNNNMNRQQINGSFNIKFQHLIDGQQKILDIHHSMPSTVTQNIIAYISTFTINPVSSNRLQRDKDRCFLLYLYTTAVLNLLHQIYN